MLNLRILQTEGFRFAALFAALFAGAALVLGVVVYLTVDNALTAELVSAVDEDIADISRGYAAHGVPEAAKIIQQRMSAAGGTDFSLLQDGDGRRLAGNLPPMAPVTGLISIPPPMAARNGSQHMVLGKGVLLPGGVYVFAGEDAHILDATLESVVRSVVWLIAATAVLAIGGGILLSMAFLGRINAITLTCEAVTAGQLGNRIPARATRNELDRLAAGINAMLDHIVALMESLRQVSSDIAHDLRTPLAHLSQRLETARLKANSTADYAVVVERAIVDCDELLAIFAALLRLSQIEAGTRRAAFEPVGLSEVLQHVANTYAAVAEDRGQHLVPDLALHVVVRGDRALLTQMFANLIENAIRHTPPGTRIGLALSLDGDAAVARISDTGAGVAAAERDKVFRRFYRLETDRGSPGHGLGLSLVAAIADLHRVQITLSDNGPGLVVTLRFPLSANFALTEAALEATA